MSAVFAVACDCFVAFVRCPVRVRRGCCFDLRGVQSVVGLEFCCMDRLRGRAVQNKASNNSVPTVTGGKRNDYRVAKLRKKEAWKRPFKTGGSVANRLNAMQPYWERAKRGMAELLSTIPAKRPSHANKIECDKVNDGTRSIQSSSQPNSNLRRMAVAEFQFDHTNHHSNQGGHHRSRRKRVLLTLKENGDCDDNDARLRSIPRFHSIDTTASAMATRLTRTSSLASFVPSDGGARRRVVLPSVDIDEINAFLGSSSKEDTEKYVSLATYVGLISLSTEED
ncbi:hypothetical protein BC830DRAFT_1077517 [Chytriomyces sp. MP71]|nr:hypothetical protein BC830DRAFT_1077517 [Chytriomyces sp. MP71]